MTKLPRRSSTLDTAMTFSSDENATLSFECYRVWLSITLIFLAGSVQAGIGEPESSIDRERVQLRATRSMRTTVLYKVHELRSPNGIRALEYVSPTGVVFGVRWSATSKPDLSYFLGTSNPTYLSAAKDFARRPGIQRQFRHDNSDLVVASTSHLNVYTGYAYRRSLLPSNVTAQELGWE
jgi:hypothetical protein